MKIVYLFKSLLFFLFLVELLLQSFFFFKVYSNKVISLFYNPYCDQIYWNLNKGQNFETYFNEEIIYHPLLSLVRKTSKVPNNDDELNDIAVNNNLIFFGSSFIDHKIFKKKLLKNKINNNNYSLSSYGLDQILLSYQLTSRVHKDKFIIFGFLMEDLDRVIFDKRNYPKIKFKYQDGIFVKSNTPIVEKQKKLNIDLYIYRFIKNFIFLYNNNFDHKQSNCSSDFKKKFFKYYISEIMSISKKQNQKVIFITFNFLNEMKKNKLNWRNKFILDILNQNNIENINTKDIIEINSKLNNIPIDKYFNKEDLHYSELGFELVIKEIMKSIGQYK